MATETKTAVIAALLGNLAIALVKLFAAIIGGSSAMLAEAAHSFSDVGNQVMLYIGLRRSHRPPTDEHPYGTSKAAYLWSFLVAIILFGVAGAFSLFEGVEKIQHPHVVDDITLSLGVLLGAFILEAWSLSVALGQAKKAARARNIVGFRQFLEENRDATLLTVLVEDSLALVGLPIAAAALLLTHYTGNPVWDGVGSIIIGLMLMTFAVFLAKEVEALLVGRGLSKRDLSTVRKVVDGDAAVEGVLSVESMYLGADTVLLGLEVDLVDGMPSHEIEATLVRLESALKTALPVLKYVYVEPRKLGKGPTG
ncbi:MAG: cation transporter [Euryarchaeota archaeon]|nr:cation transporter [Euryarchaeota archaeon]